MNPFLLMVGSLVFGQLLSGCATTEPLMAGGGQPGPAMQATTVELAAPVHFLAPDGSDVMVGPGAFDVTASGGNLHLSGQPSGPAVDLAAHPTEHDIALANAVALLLKPEQDTHLVLLQPGGAALDAVGSDSGIRTRGVATAFLSKATLTAQVTTLMFAYTITPALTPWGFGPCVRPAGANHMSIDPGSIQPPGSAVPVIWGGASFPVPGGSCAYTTVTVTSPTALPYDLPNQRLHAYVPMYDHQTTPSVVTMIARHDYTFNWNQTSYVLPQVILADGREPLALGMPQTVQTVAGFYASKPAGVPIRFELRAGPTSVLVATKNCTLRVNAASMPSLSHR